MEVIWNPLTKHCFQIKLFDQLGFIDIHTGVVVMQLVAQASRAGAERGGDQHPPVARSEIQRMVRSGHL